MNIVKEKSKASGVLYCDLLDIQVSIENAQAVLESISNEFFVYTDPENHIDSILLAFDRYYKFTRASSDCLYRAKERLDALINII